MPTTDSSPLAPGYRLDRYELLGPLAEGGMASVWIARQRGKHGFEKLVAIKTILPQYASDDRFRQMFLDEARIASRIEHFNVARILDLGEEHDVLYLVMEYVDGDSLSKLRRATSKAKVRIPPGVALRVLADACSGLHEAHELRGDDGQPLDIVHRDVSPHNILVSAKGVTKVIDFGIAKARDRMAGETNAGVLKGKIQYMAPEQAIGRKVDRRADLWAIGASLYHLLAGKVPYDADNTLGTLHLLSSGRPPEPLPPYVPPAVAAVARQALSAPDARFQTAAQMRDAIESAMIEAGVPTTASDVAHFVIEQLGERTAKRRQIIDIALAAAAERQRVEEALRPQPDPLTGSGLTSAPSLRTLPEAPDALRHVDSGRQALAPGAQASPASAHNTSAGTMASEIVELPRTRHTGVFVAVGAVAAAAIGVAIFAMRQGAPAGSAPQGAPVVSGATSSPAPGASAGSPTAGSPTAGSPTAPSSAAAPSAAPSSSIPVISLSDLPKADEVEPSAPPPRVAPAPRPPPPPATPRPARPPKKIDDGF